MRYLALLLGLVVLCAGNAGAQLNASNYTLLPQPTFGAVSAVTAPAPSGSTSTLDTAIFSSFASASPVTAPVAAPLSPTDPALMLAPAPAPKPQDVTSVFENYAWQAYVGYSFVRFYELPNTTKNTNGYNFSVVYYIKDHLGIDGEFQGDHLSQGGTGGWLLFAGGGPRFRWALPRNMEIWAHGLGGWSHFTPQTAAGNRQAPAFEAGGGLDIAFRSRLSLRFAADCVGTYYFGTYQFSPKGSAGIVFKF
jgi:hypothetical protein